MSVRVSIETTTGTLEAKPLDELTLADVLALRRLPANLFQAYVDRGNGRPRPLPSDTLLNALPDGSEITMRCIMNPNFSEFLEIVTTRHAAENAVTTVEEMEFGQEGCEKIVHELDDAMARVVVEQRVAAFVASTVTATCCRRCLGRGRQQRARRCASNGVGRLGTAACRLHAGL
jgi:hypothetical protein